MFHDSRTQTEETNSTRSTLRGGQLPFQTFSIFHLHPPDEENTTFNCINQKFLFKLAILSNRIYKLACLIEDQSKNSLQISLPYHLSLNEDKLNKQKALKMGLHKWKELSMYLVCGIIQSNKPGDVYHIKYIHSSGSSSHSAKEKDISYFLYSLWPSST